MKYDRSNLYCFSPLVMIITFVSEIIMAAYTVWRYKMNEIARVILAMLIFLAIFQLAEYMVCEGSIIGNITWSRLGFMAITMLPPLGIHAVYAIVKTERRLLLYPAYMLAAGFLLFFLAGGGAISGYECLGNYVIFQVAPGLGGLFGAYYYILLAIGAALAWRYYFRVKADNTKRALTGFVMGYATFIVPTATVNIISPDTVRGIPSIMCGFAALLSIAMVVLVIPNAGKLKKQS